MTLPPLGPRHRPVGRLAVGYEHPEGHTSWQVVSGVGLTRCDADRGCSAELVAACQLGGCQLAGRRLVIGAVLQHPRGLRVDQQAPEIYRAVRLADAWLRQQIVEGYGAVGGYCCHCILLQGADRDVWRNYTSYAWRCIVISVQLFGRLPCGTLLEESRRKAPLSGWSDRGSFLVDCRLHGIGGLVGLRLVAAFVGVLKFAAQVRNEGQVLGIELLEERGVALLAGNYKFG